MATDKPGVVIVGAAALRADDAVAGALAGRGWQDAPWVAPRDVDEVDALVAAGAVRTVCFATAADLLRVLWDERAAVAEWAAQGTQIVVVRGDGVASAVTIDELGHTWAQWRQQRRRQRTVAGLVLSLLVLAAAFVLVAM